MLGCSLGAVFTKIDKTFHNLKSYLDSGIDLMVNLGTYWKKFEKILVETRLQSILRQITFIRRFVNTPVGLS